jgi:MFS transporter, DHA2 family, multidrug resistance protein
MAEAMLVDSGADRSPAVRSIRGSWPVLFALALATAVVTIDNTVLNVALPSIAQALHAGESQLQWIGNAYSLLFGGLLLTAGNLADRLGRRRVLLGGLAAFGCISALVVFVTGANELIALRALTGVAAAFVMPSTLALLFRLFEGPARTTAMTVWSVITVLGFVGGPLLGGAILAHFSWHAVFLLNVPIAAVAGVVAARKIPESADPTGEAADLVGAALSIATLGALVFTLVNGPVAGWTSPRALGGVGALLVAGVAFYRWEQRSAHPLIPLPLLRQASFSGPVFAEGALMFSITGLLFLLTQQFQLVEGHSPIEAGLRTAPAAVGSLLASWPGVFVARRFGQHVAAGLGYLLCALGLVVAELELTAPFWRLAVGLVIFGMGLRMAMTPIALAVVNALPKERAGVGSALNDTFQEIGGVLGVAILGSVLNSVYRAHAAVASSLTAGLVSRDAAVAARARQAFTLGNRWALLVCAGLMLAASLVASRTVPAELVDPDDAAGAQEAAGAIDAPGVGPGSLDRVSVV